MNYLDDFLIYIEKYSNKVNIEIVTKALYVADSFHKNQLRKSNLPYITHPIAVAKGLLEYGFDTDTVVAGLLHDVIEDTGATAEFISETFGETVYQLVLGLTKLQSLRLSLVEDNQISNYRKFMLATSKDIRVLIVKLFDRLDNMRTIQFLPKIEKQRRIAEETLNIYVPLAGRISLHALKDELEDLCFQVLEPAIRDVIIQNLDYLNGVYGEALAGFINKIQDLLKTEEIPIIKLENRVKSPYSTWQKVIKGKNSFYDIKDLFAFRIVTDSVENCYKIIGLIHTNYSAYFKKFKDYISTPKKNGYKSIHSTLMIKADLLAEVQIRTEEMDKFANLGIASHWNYKNQAEGKQDVYSWLENFSNLINHSNVQLADIFEYSKLELFRDEIFVFTPKGELITLPEGATALDFAYNIHSDIGNHCVKVLVNGAIQPLHYKLKTGQKVEVFTSAEQEPQMIWLNYVQTGIAKISIRKHYNYKSSKKIKEQALAILHYMFDKRKLYFYPGLIRQILDALNLKNEHMFYQQLVENKIQIENVLKKLFPLMNSSANNEIKQCSSVELKNIDNNKLKSHSLRVAQCCYCCYGDPIIGLVIPNNSIDIHHADCSLVCSSYSSEFSTVAVKWTKKNYSTYLAKIKISLIENGSFKDISQYINDNGLIVVKLSHNKKSFTQQENNIHLDNIFILIIEVLNISEVNEIIDDLTTQFFVEKAIIEVN